jgi:hypothetical protein
MPGASDLVSDDEVPIACLYILFSQRLCDQAAATSLADRADEAPMPRLLPLFALVVSDSDHEVLFSCPACSRPFACPRPAPQASGRGRRPLGHCKPMTYHCPGYLVSKGGV